MSRAALFTAVVLAAAGSTARADGFFYQQSYGVSSARGRDADVLGASLQLRIALGWRWGAFQVGPTLSGQVAGRRDDAFYGVVGGVPEEGDSDMEAVGVDARYNERLVDNISIYVRGGPRWGHGTAGVLDGAAGWGVGAGTGVALTGKVRALGFLFIPLFFSRKGPLVNATVFLDHNVDWYSLRGNGMDVSLPIIGTSVGIGAGSFF